MASPSRADADQRVHPLPEEVGGVEVDAEGLAADLPEPVERIGVVGDESRVQLDRDPHATVPGVGRRFRPVGSGPLVPLPLEGLGEVRRPGAGHPVRLHGLRPTARAAGEGDHRRHPELLGELHRIAVVAIVRLGDLAPRMERITMAGEGADLQPAGGDRVLEPLPRRVVFEQRRGICVRRSGISAHPDLDGLAAGGRDVVQRLLERSLAEQDREDSDFHMRTLSFFRIRRTGSAHAGHGSNSSLEDNHASCQPVAPAQAVAAAIRPIIPKVGSPYRKRRSSSMTD